MSGLIKSVVKKFKKSGILGKIAIAAAVWWTAGVASAYFSAPSVGLGQAMTASTESMFSAVSAATGSGTFVTPAEAAAASAAPIMPAATVTQLAPGATEITNTGQALAEMTTPQIASEAALNQSFNPALTGGAGTGVTSAAGGAAGTGVTSAAGGAAETGFWGKNGGLIAGMIGGNAVMGAMASADAEEQRKHEEEVRRSRGLFGVDYGGTPAKSGLIRSQQVDQQVPQAQIAQTVATPGIQQYTPMQPVTRPVNRSNLPALQEQGLVAQQKRQVV